MERCSIMPRTNWQAIVEDQGLVYHKDYWKEGAYYSFSMDEINRIEAATNELQERCLEAVQHVIDERLFRELHIPEEAFDAIISDWNNETPSIYGRFDLAYDGNNIKMLEYNADTPTSLLEAAVIQWYWKEDVFKSKDQFNSIHERLVEKWKELKKFKYIKNKQHFSCVRDSEEDIMNTSYLMETAIQAGINVESIFIDEIGYDSNRGAFVDMHEEVIESIFKLYPYEWLINEKFGERLLNDRLTYWIEPRWKMIMSNKTFMVILNKMFPNHSNLLATYHEREKFGSSYVRKPILSREGSNITISNLGLEIKTDGEYGEEGFIYQEYFAIPKFNGKTPIIGSWVIDGQAAGIGIREGDIITDNRSNFIPHIIE